MVLVGVKKLARIKVRGIVQGVGFRPFVFRLAHDYNLKGWVRNTSGSVEIEVEGDQGEAEEPGRELLLSTEHGAPPRRPEAAAPSSLIFRGSGQLVAISILRAQGPRSFSSGVYSTASSMRRVSKRTPRRSAWKK